MSPKPEKKVAILQSSYIPWKGYFDVIASVDEFIFYDEVQYTRNDWRNRNKIKTPNGLSWLTIPVGSKGFQTEHIKISDVRITEPKWSKKHWATIEQNYRKAPFFKQYREQFAHLYELASREERLAPVNHLFITAINEMLGIKTKITHSCDYGIIDGQTERLIDLVQKAGGTEYLSGPAAKDYINESLFEQAGIKLSWMDYSGYPEYPQLYPPFEHAVSIIDLLFNCGDEAVNFMKNK